MIIDVIYHASAFFNKYLGKKDDTYILQNNYTYLIINSQKKGAYLTLVNTSKKVDNNTTQTRHLKIHGRLSKIFYSILYERITICYLLKTCT